MKFIEILLEYTANKKQAPIENYHHEKYLLAWYECFILTILPVLSYQKDFTL